MSFGFLNTLLILDMSENNTSYPYCLYHSLFLWTSISKKCRNSEQYQNMTSNQSGDTWKAMRTSNLWDQRSSEVREGIECKRPTSLEFLQLHWPWDCYKIFLCIVPDTVFVFDFFTCALLSFRGEKRLGVW